MYEVRLPVSLLHERGNLTYNSEEASRYVVVVNGILGVLIDGQR